MNILFHIEQHVPSWMHKRKDFNLTHIFSDVDCFSSVYFELYHKDPLPDVFINFINASNDNYDEVFKYHFSLFAACNALGVPIIQIISKDFDMNKMAESWKQCFVDMNIMFVKEKALRKTLDSLKKG